MRAMENKVTFEGKLNNAYFNEEPYEHEDEFQLGFVDCNEFDYEALSSMLARRVRVTVELIEE